MFLIFPLLTVSGGTRKEQAHKIHPYPATEIFSHFSPAVVVIERQDGTGSGFFIDPKGILVTNFHVAADQNWKAQDLTIISKSRFNVDPEEGLGFGH